MAMKINLMDERKIGKYGREDIDNSVYTQASKGRKQALQSAIGTLLFFGLASLAPACYADSTTKEVTSVQAPAPKDSVNKNTPYVTQNSSPKVAQTKAEAAVTQKKIRILVKAFDMGEKQAKETKYFDGSVKTTYSDNNEGKTIMNAIERELINRQRSGKFNTSGMYAIVVDTDMPDSQEADMAIKGTGRREGGKYKFDVKVVGTKTGDLLYAYGLELRDRPGVEELGGELIAGALDNYFSEQE